MAKGKTSESLPQEDSDLLAVVEATDPQAAIEADPPRDAPREEKVTEAPTAPPPPLEAPRRSGAGAFFGMVLGGVLAAAAGFGLARAMPELLAVGGDDTLSTAVATQAEEIAALRAEIAAPNPQLEARIAALEEALPAEGSGDLVARIDGLETALADLAARPTTDGSAASPQLLAELEDLKQTVATLNAGGGVPADVIAAAEAAEARLKEAEASATAMAEAAEAAAADSRRNAAAGRIAAALDTGAPYASALPDLGDAGLPAVLVDNAAMGLPTVAELADSFPAVARASLEDALRANMGESWTDRVSSFLRSQTGLRSLTPREGNDPDAVLSRAEAALVQGRVADAVTELAAMPDAGKPALTDWLTQAQLRVDAEAAVAALAAN